MSSRTVAVTGATGQLGREIVRALAALDGVIPVAVARTPEKGADLGVEVRAGSYDDAQQLQAAFAGVDAVVLVSGNAPPDARLPQHKNVIDSTARAGVGRLVYVGIVIDDTGSAFSSIQQMSLATEEHLRASGLAWCVGRNGIYIEPDLDYIDHYVAAGKITNCAGNGRCGYTSRSEVAAAFAQMATDARHDGRIYNLTGEPITQQQLARTMNEVFGTSLAYKAVSVEDYRAERVAELGDYMGTVVAGIYESIRSGGMDQPSNFEEAAGRAHETPTEMMLAYKKNKGAA